MDIAKSIQYFYNLIDDHGIIQFSKGYEKDYRFGYAIEDQARALILAIKLKDNQLINKLAGLIRSSFAGKNGVYMLRNPQGKLKRKVDHFGEASAEVLWALCLYRIHTKDRTVDSLIKALKTGLLQSNNSRVIAYTILGLAAVNDKKNISKMADKLVNMYQKNSDGNWQWYENFLTYANALLPWSLLTVYSKINKKSYLITGQKTLHFLLDNLTLNNHPIAVGNKGWWHKTQKMALYDQQPIDISYQTLACLEAFRILKDKLYLEKALFYFSWFNGNNLGRRQIIRDDGGCYDGLKKTRFKKNCGAEAIICFLLANLNIKDMEKNI